MPTRPKLLYASHLTYPARGRRYCDEDIYLTSKLRDHFDLAICHPEDAATLMPDFDTVVVRNTGPVIDYPAAYQHFREQAKARRQRVYNPLTGKADMAGKQYLVDLTEQGYPVIPTIDRAAHLDRLPEADQYVVKPKAGADSHGLRFVHRDELPADETPSSESPTVETPTGESQNSESPNSEPQNSEPGEEILIQPKIDFRYEVSFYFVDQDFQYALHAPDPSQRWELTTYDPTSADLEFAGTFIAWNSLDHGIQRVDACRTRDGDLLLVELEDLNPYLSLDRTTDRARENFVKAMTSSIQRSLA